MRDSNYRSIINNRAAVTITTSLYDRRALDVTADKPLVNSLNHLTYLVSSSAKVRETLSNDGGIERLVEILHECHDSTFNVQDNIFNSEKKLLTAWKWTLAFQCLVLIGTRGTEKIRQKVVRAGMLPIIATVLDNYMNMHEVNVGSGSSNAQPACAYMHPRFGDHTDAPTTGPTFLTNYELEQEAFMNIRYNNGDPRQPQQQDSIPAEALNAAAVVPPITGANTTPPPNGPVNGSVASNVTGRTTPVPSSQLEPQNENLNIYNAYFNDSYINSLTSEDYDMLSVDQLFKIIRGNLNLAPTGDLANAAIRSSVNNDIRRRYLIVSIMKKLKEEKKDGFPDNCLDGCEYDMDNNLQFLSDLYLQDEKSTHISNIIHAKIAPRYFTETGVVIPRDDDVVWCLQLLAYISKYPYLKEVLQNTHLITDMSIRHKQLRLFSEREMKSKLRNLLALASRQTLIPRSRKGRPFSPGTLPHSSTTMGSGDSYIQRFDPSPSSSPRMLSDLNIHNENFDLTEDKLNLFDKAEDEGLTEDAEADDEFDDDEESDHRNKDDEKDVEDYLSKFDNEELSTDLNRLYDSIIDAESIVNDLDRELALFRITDKINNHIEAECQNLSNTIIEERLKQKEYLSKKWNYETYKHFDIDDDDNDSTEDRDYDQSLIEFKKVNLFPMVERFTFLAGTDMYYWSGVIMRNSCRRNDYKGGVRQCGNLECGKWEKYPREFSKCKKCKRTKYCSRECQMRAWHCHKNWCVPSNSSTGSTATTGSTNYEGAHETALVVASVTATLDSDATTGDTSQQVSAVDNEAEMYEQ
ncbi:CIC11C00000003329 [Sungouiella intermedia]|uniref:CIC11C00000003329 n=1 Tax=Sungouiella intermedia TaxID=45354 RepID=A0A1L0BKF8_9ASCO|nr:CIC11C00000003329 [[Candida] intermedia]